MANQWLTGSGVPSTGIGQVTDYYRDTVSNLVYYRENAFTWVVVPAFTPSPDGIGTTWLHGATAPLTAQGSDGDYFYEDTHKIVYRKEGATWVAKGSLDFIGIYGVQWGNGLGAPVSSVPLDALPAGSFYLDVVTSDIYYKGPSMSWELKGQLGDGGGGGGGSPINLITTIEEVAELDVTSAVTPSVIYDLDLLKADLASPAFTGAPTAPTPQTEPSLDNSTKLATTEFVNVVADAAVATANAYADGLVVNLWDDRGTFNPSSGAWPTSANGGSGVSGAIQAGDVWTSSGAGTLTGGITVEVGDVIRALVDLAGNTSTDWAVTQNNIGYTAENSANKATDLSSPDDIKYPTTQAVVTALGGYEPELPANVGSVKFLREDRTWQTAPAPVLTEANFSVAKTGQPTYTVTWVLTALTTASLWTVPDKAINFGDLSSIATTNSNTLSGTHTRILGGNNNNVSGTDNVVTGSSYCTVSGTGNIVTQCLATIGGSVISVAGNKNRLINCLGFTVPLNFNGNTLENCDSTSIPTTLSTTGVTFKNCTIHQFQGTLGGWPNYSMVYGVGLGSTVCEAFVYSNLVNNAGFVALVTLGSGNNIEIISHSSNQTYGISVHDVELLFHSFPSTNARALFRRQVIVSGQGAILDIATVGTDVVIDGVTFTVMFTVVSGRLRISASSNVSYNSACKARVTSTYA